MGLGAGGQMEQEIYDDSYGFDDWDLRHSSRCFVHLTNSMVWRAITGGDPPTVPPTSSEYSKAGLPWFDYYSDSKAVEGSEKLATVKGAGSPADPAVRSAIELIESGKYPMERLVTHAFSLEEAAEALVTLAGKHPERKAINVIMTPHG